MMTTGSSAPKGVTVKSTEILDELGVSVRSIDPAKEYVIAITVSAEKVINNVSTGFNIKLANGVVVYGTSTALLGKFSNFAAGETRTIRFSFKPTLSFGAYYLSAGVAETLTPDDEVHNYVMLDFVHDALPFAVASTRDSGIADLKSKLVSLEKIEKIHGH